MNYFLPRNYFFDEKNYLSDKIKTKESRNIRDQHIKEVIHYVEEDVTMYQCSKCKEFHKTFDLHDNWDFVGEQRILSSFSNLCFKCHALEHLEKIYNIDGSLKTGNYRGAEIKEFHKVLEQHYQDVLKQKDFKKDLKQCLETAQKKMDSKLIFKNDYGLIEAYNSFYFRKSPIKI